MNELVRALALESRFEDPTRAILFALTNDPHAISYRQDALADLLNNDALAEGLRKELPALAQLAFLGNSGRPNDSALQQCIFRLGELELYVDGVSQLRALLLACGDRVKSTAFVRLRDALTAAEQDPAFLAVRAELPDMLAKVRNIGSITVGINLDNMLLPVEATLLSINAHRFRAAGVPFLNKLFKDNDAIPSQGIGKLHRVSLPNDLPYTKSNLMLVPLFRDLSELLDATARPVAEALSRYTRLSGRILVALAGEIAFLLGAAQLTRKLQRAGMPMCKPHIETTDSRLFDATGMFNIQLALRMLTRDGSASLAERIVLNDSTFNDDARIYILTGPNQGGKTTFIQSLGLVQVMAQAGLHVPAKTARLSPVDAIYTHFAADEKPGQETGRLGEEAKRLSDIFARATRHSLVLLNESLSSTSPTEAIVIAEDVTRGLRLLGARAVFATHLHGLAEACDQINANTTGDSRVATLAALVEGDEGKRTFRIVPAPPSGHSHAHDIARRYGLSFEQLEQVIRNKKS